MSRSDRRYSDAERSMAATVGLEERGPLRDVSAGDRGRLEAGDKADVTTLKSPTGDCTRNEMPIGAGSGWPGRRRSGREF
jgi:hypothetical protein